MGNDQGLKDELRALLAKTIGTKKHSAYQILPSKLEAALGSAGVELHPKYEKERLDYILSRVEMKGKSFLDIGCNTGYFMLEMLENGARETQGYEGGEYHAEFVKKAIELLQLTDKAEVLHKYYDFNKDREPHDVTMLFNVLHHLGDDYGDSSLGMESAKAAMLEQLNSLHGYTDILLFQMGYNWHGNIKTCLFDHGTKAEAIDFITWGTREYWDVVAIGIAQRTPQGVIYEDLNSTNILRDDVLGEFLNRPIFILRAKRL